MRSWSIWYENYMTVLLVMINNALFSSRKSRSHPRIWDDISVRENKLERARDATTILHVGPTRAKRRPKVDHRSVVNCITAIVVFASFFEGATLQIGPRAQEA